MTTWSAVCIFCEDIRQEKSDQDIIIGTLPDNLVGGTELPPIPDAQALLPRLGFYLRINFSADSAQPSRLSMKILNPKGEILAQNYWSQESIDKTFEDSKKNQMPVIGFISKVVASPLPVSAGKLTVVVNVDDKEMIAGALNIILPNASSPPSSQSPSVS